MQTNYQPTENYSFFEYENQIGNTLPQFQTNLESVYTVNGSWNSQSSIFQTLEEDSEFPSLFSQSTDDLPLLDTNFDGSLAQAYDNTPLSLETPFADDFFETDSIFEDDDDDYSSGSSTTSSSSVSTIASPTNMSAGLLNPFAPETYETKNHVIDILSFLNWNPNFMLQNATFQALKPSQEQQSMCSQIVVKMEEKPFLISVVPLTNDNQPQEFVKAEPTAPVAIKKENGKCARKVKKEEKEGTHKIKKPKVAQKTVAALKKEVTLEVAASGCNPLKEEVEITSQNGFFTMVRGVTSPNAEKVIGGKGCVDPIPKQVIRINYDPLFTLLNGIPNPQCTVSVKLCGKKPKTDAVEIVQSLEERTFLLSELKTNIVSFEKLVIGHASHKYGKCFFLCFDFSISGTSIDRLVSAPFATITHRGIEKREKKMKTQTNNKKGKRTWVFVNE